MYVEYVPGTKHAGSKAERSETMDTFTDCGLLLNNEDVVIDIDHLPKESIKALIAEFGLQTRTIWTGACIYGLKSPPGSPEGRTASADWGLTSNSTHRHRTRKG